GLDESRDQTTQSLPLCLRNLDPVAILDVLVVARAHRGRDLGQGLVGCTQRIRDLALLSNLVRELLDERIVEYSIADLLDVDAELFRSTTDAVMAGEFVEQHPPCARLR